jgi:uncharacterized membrane protein (UPF0127 family)
VQTWIAPATSAVGRLRITNDARGTILAERTSRARSFLARFRGLMGVRELPAGAGLLIEGDNAIHTCFMRFPIDVAFLDEDGRVLHLVHRMPAWRASRIVWRARAVLELPAGTLEGSGTRLGDRLAAQPSAA